MWLHHLQSLQVPSSRLRKAKNHQTHSLFLPVFVYSNGLNGTISVYPLEGTMAGMMPTPASANSPTAYTILDVDQNAYLFVGGILGTVKVSLCFFVCVQHQEPACLFYFPPSIF